MVAQDATLPPAGMIHLVSYAPVPQRDLYFRYHPVHKTANPAPGVPAAFEPPSLPAYTVDEYRVEQFRARDLYTKEGMADVEFEKNPGLHFGNFYDSNKPLAVEMFTRDDWRARAADYRDMARAMSVGGDKQESRQIIDQVDDQDLTLQAEAGQTTESIVSPDLFEVSRMNDDNATLRLPELPIDVPFVRIRW
jgi:hypothetical protein